MNIHVEGANARATGSALVMARFLGASSPNTIWATVARTNAVAKAIPKLADSGTPKVSRTGSIAPAIAGSAMNPTTNDVTVMPNWAPDSMKLSC